MDQTTTPRTSDGRADASANLLDDLDSLTSALAADTTDTTASASPDASPDASPPWSIDAAEQTETMPLHRARPYGALGTNWIPRASEPTPEPRPAPSDMLAEGADLRTEMVKIIAGGGPTIVFQPVVHIETGIVVGAEALSRFPGPLATIEWFDAAHQLDLGNELELSAVANALDRLDEVTWDRAGWNFVGLNVSVAVVMDERFDRLLADHPTDRLMVELTEHTTLPDLPVLRRHLDGLRDRDVRIAVNGLRCIPANIDRIMMIQPEIVKLDVGFTAALVRDAGGRDDAIAMLDRCRREGVVVVAVGVEQPDELDLLCELGIDAVQGHLFGLPFEVGPDAI